MQNILSKIKEYASLHRSRVIAISVFLFVFLFLAVWIPSRVRTVNIIYNGVSNIIKTSSLDAYEMIESQGIVLEPDDSVEFSGFDRYGFFGDFGKNTCVIDIESTFDVNINADGFLYHVTLSNGDTVSDAIEVSGLEVRSEDYLDKDEDSLLSAGTSIKLTRVDYVTSSDEEPIERGQTYRSTSLFTNGRTSIISYGKDGKMLRTYQHKLVDGVETESILISEEVLKAPVDDIYLIGDGGACSPLDYGYNIVNNVPTSYKKVYSNVRATGYYAPKGAGTASGRRAQMGYVAVDPKVIPYGTKLWIVGHGNSKFVYGYALAADTGGAMRSGKNFVDLYYDTYYECVLNSVKYVDVYILE